MSEFVAGQVVTIVYPFVRETYEAFDEDGAYKAPTWKPGIRYEMVHGYFGEPTYDVVADGNGSQILTIIDIHKPGKYPTRVFYTVKWVTPEGKTFGKGNLRILTLEAFRRRAKGFMSHEVFFEYRLSEAVPHANSIDGVAA